MAQEFSNSPDVVEMRVGVLTDICDLHIHFQVGVRNHTQVSQWHHRCGLILTHIDKSFIWYVYAFELLFTSYNQEFRLAVIRNHRALQFCHTLPNGSDGVSLIRGGNGSEWQVNLVIIGIALGFLEVSFYDLCRMLCYGQPWQWEWLSGHPRSVKYQSVHSGVLFLCCVMVYKPNGLMGLDELCSYGHSTGYLMPLQ